MITKSLVLIGCFLCVTAEVQGQTGSAEVNLDAGILENALGTARVRNGALVELLESPSGSLSAPTSSSYTTGDNVLVASFAMNSNSGVAGELLESEALNVSSTPLAGYLTQGEDLFLRFYPSLLYASAPAAPTLGTTYGQVRANGSEFGDLGETGWIVPAPSTTADINYITANDGGSYSNASADAFNTVLVAVPEPNTYALLAFSFISLLGLRAWRVRRDAA